MKVRRVLVGMVLVALGLIWPGSPAMAGGATFEFDRPFYRPGALATGHVELWFRHGVKRLPRGPFHAYLIPGRAFLSGSAGFSPSNRSIGIRRVRLTLSPSPSDAKIALARIRFRVPSLDVGDYMLEVCTPPCYKMATVGDLVGGWMSIGTPVERQLADARRDIGRRMDRIEAVSATGALVRQVGDGLARRLGRVEQRLASVVRGSRPPLGLALAGWLVAGMAGLAAGFLLRRRRSVGPRLDSAAPPVRHSVNGGARSSPDVRWRGDHPELERVRGLRRRAAGGGGAAAP